MSLLIKGMEMPKEDEEIIIRISSDGTVMTEYALPITGVKAVPVPPHGRLIDADALEEKTDDRYSLGEIGRRERNDIVDALRYCAPTIIPAEEGEK